MKKVVILSMLAALVLASCDNKVESGPVKLNTTVDSVSYALGVNIARNMQIQEIDSVDLDVFIRGMKEFNSGDSQFDDATSTLVVNKYFNDKEAEKGREMIDAADKWMEDKAAEEGIQSTASGLLYRIVKPGDETRAQVVSQVTFDYEGKLIDGTVFDTSYGNKPLVYPLNGLVKGMQEGMQLIGAGGEIELYIPYELGYGPRPGPGGLIPAYSPLQFKGEVVEINTPE